MAHEIRDTLPRTGELVAFHPDRLNTAFEALTLAGSTERRALRSRALDAADRAAVDTVAAQQHTRIQAAALDNTRAVREAAIEARAALAAHRARKDEVAAAAEGTVATVPLARMSAVVRATVHAAAVAAGGNPALQGPT